MASYHIRRINLNKDEYAVLNSDGKQVSSIMGLKPVREKYRQLMQKNAPRKSVQSARKSVAAAGGRKSVQKSARRSARRSIRRSARRSARKSPFLSVVY